MKCILARKFLGQEGDFPRWDNKSFLLQAEKEKRTNEQ